MTHPTARLALAALAAAMVLFVVVLALLEALSSAGVPW